MFEIKSWMLYIMDVKSEMLCKDAKTLQTKKIKYRGDALKDNFLSDNFSI